jgi:hypothetical protein
MSLAMLEEIRLAGGRDIHVHLLLLLTETMETTVNAIEGRVLARRIGGVLPTSSWPMPKHTVAIQAIEKGAPPSSTHSFVVASEQTDSSSCTLVKNWMPVSTMNYWKGIVQWQ